MLLPRPLIELPKPLAYVWEEEDCRFDCHYTPAGPGGPFGIARNDGRKSFAIYTEEQLIEYARLCVQASKDGV